MYYVSAVYLFDRKIVYTFTCKGKVVSVNTYYKERKPNKMYENEIELYTADSDESIAETYTDAITRILAFKEQQGTITV